MQFFFSNIAIYAIALFITAFLLPLALTVALIHRIYPCRRMQMLLYRMAFGYGQVLLFFMRPWLPVKFENRDAIMRYEPCIIISNHQSMLDLFLFAATKPAVFCYMIKSWPLKKLFFYAPVMKELGYVNVDEHTPEEIDKICMERIASGVSVVVFPEGTRSRNGKLGKFHSGAFRLATKAGVPVLPLAIKNSGAVAPPGCLLLRPQTILMRFLPPLYPGEFLASPLPHRAMLREAKKRYLAYLGVPTPKE